MNGSGVSLPLPLNGNGMVVNITKSSSTMTRPLMYNELKVEMDVASVIASFNMDGDSEEDIISTFERYERLNIKSRNVSFHMNINPLEGQDNMSEREVVDFARKMMEGLGYGRQPYVIYRHNDISREHYHVISVRTNEKGKKIPDYREKRRCNDLMWSLAGEFDYKVGNAYRKRRERRVEKFDPHCGDVTEQIREIYKNCLAYHFTSFEQWVTILRSYGVEVEARAEGNTRLYLRGLDGNGKPCTKSMTDGRLGLKLSSLYMNRAVDSAGGMKVMSMERNRIRRCTLGPLEESVSQRHFANMMSGLGITVRLERDAKTGRITDANFVDHVTKTAFNISELGPDLTLDMLRDADEGKWEHDKAQTGVDITLGDFLSGLASGNSKSREKDLRDDRRRRKGRKMKI